MYTILISLFIYLLRTADHLRSYNSSTIWSIKMTCIFILLPLSALECSFIILLTIASFRSSQWKIGVMYKKCSSNFANVTKKTHVLEPVLNKVAGLRANSFIKKIFQHRCFPEKFAKFLRTLILKNICERLLLFIYSFKRSEGSGHWNHGSI